MEETAFRLLMDMGDNYGYWLPVWHNTLKAGIRSHTQWVFIQKDTPEGKENLKHTSAFLARSNLDNIYLWLSTHKQAFESSDLFELMHEIDHLYYTYYKKCQ